MNNSRWIKRAGDTYSPSSIVCICVGTNERMVDGKIRMSESTFHHVSVATSIRKRGRWSLPILRHFTDRDDFWNWLHTYGNKKYCTYVYAPIASNALTLLGFWDVIDVLGAKMTRYGASEQAELSTSPIPLRPPSGNHSPESFSESPRDKHSPAFMIQSYVVTGKVDIVKYKVNGRSFAWSSSSQYLDIDENELAKALEFTWSSSCYSDENPTAITHNSKDRSQLWLLFHQTLADWWISIDGGPWGQTISQLAYSFWRRRLENKRLLVHGDTFAYSIEEQAVFGGRASLWCLAPVGSESNWQEHSGDCPNRHGYPLLPGAIVHVDAKAMYPTLLASRKYPTRFIGTYQDVPIQSLADLCCEHGVIASVLLNTDESEYPYRKGDRVIYPIGTFPTTLTGPDLEYALKRGHIAKCHYANIYKMGEPFKEAAELLLQYREEFRANGSYVWELLIKQLSNSLGGKLAQRSYRWIPRPEIIPPINWGQYASVNYDRGTSSVFRCIAGMALERAVSSSAPRVLASCYAYMTGYARQAMISLRRACRPSLVVSQDTDGLWIVCREDDRDILRRMNMVAESLTIRKTGSYNVGLWLSPSHYWIDGSWTLAGFRIVTVASDILRVVSERMSNPITLGTNSPPSTIRVIRETKELTCETIDGTPDESGWIKPLLLRVDGT